jgi:hypothetical protein
VAAFVQRAAVEDVRAPLQPSGFGGGMEARDLGAAAHRHSGDGDEGQAPVTLDDEMVDGGRAASKLSGMTWATSERWHRVFPFRYSTF